MTDIILINPLDVKNQAGDFFPLFKKLKKIRILPPLGLAYIASFLRQNNFSIQIIDANVLCLSLKQLKQIIISQKPKIIGITTLTATLNSALNTFKLIKEINDKIVTVMGGVHATVMPLETLEFHRCIDYGIIQDGEIPMLELVKRLMKGASITDVPGLVFRGDDNSVHINPNDALIRNIDEIPFPARDLLPMERYYDITSRSYHTTSVVSSRGCPFKCVFCERDIRGGKLRMRSAKNFIDEIEHIIKRYNLNEILFYDDTFTIDRKRVIEICAEIERRRLNFSWDCRTRADTIDEEMLKFMRRAGCRRISIGIESADQRILDNLNKGITVEESKKAVELIKKADIEVLAYFMFGSPGDDKETIKKTFKFSKTLEPDFAYYSITVGYPGTDLLDMAIKMGLTPKDYWTEYVKNNGILTNRLPYFEKNGLNRKFIDNFQRDAYLRFYSRPKYILSRLKKIRSIGDISWYLRMAKSLLG